MIYDLGLPAILTSFFMCERRKVKYDVLMSENTAVFKQNTVLFSVSDKKVKCLCVVAVIVAEILHFVISYNVVHFVISYHYLRNTGQISDIRYIKGLNVTKYCKSSRLSI